MTTETTNAVYDPDEAPERSFDFIGVITKSVRLESQADAYAVDEAAGERYAKMCKNGDTALWFIEAQALDRRWEDGNAYVVREFLFLNDPQGKPLPKGAMPSILAQAFLEHGYSISYAKVGTPASAVGKAFRLSEYDRPRKRSVKKSDYADTRLFPTEFMGEGYVFDGEVIEITSSRNSEATDVDGTSVAAPSVDVEAVLKQTLNGCNIDDLFDTILTAPQLKKVGTYAGVPLLDAASDGSLVQVLVKNKAFTVEDGVLVAR